MEQNEETSVQSPNPPQKKPRLDLALDDSESETSEEEKEWFKQLQQKQLIRAFYENAMNTLIEQSGITDIETEAVSMAIRSHGLTCATQGLITKASNNLGWYYQAERGDRNTPIPSTSRSACMPCSSTSRDDILSQAVTAAIRKKGLGAADR